jgi:DNA-binding MarR family transcriptional regulator
MMNPGKLLILLNGTCRLFIQHANRVFSESGCPVGYLQFVVLKTLNEIEPGDALSIKSIADSIGVERSTLSHNSDVLERDGYIEKECKKPGQLITVLSLTEAGKSVVADWMGTYEALTAKVTTDVSEELKKDLKKIERNLL